MRTPERPLAFALGAAITTLAAAATAVEPLAEPAATSAVEPVWNVPAKPAPKVPTTYSLFTGGIGMIALPAAQVCSTPNAPCQPGETSLALTLASVIRWRRFAAGAGTDVAFGLRPEQGVRAAGRDHVRSYFSFDTIFRYYLPVNKRWEWWVGGNIGAIVLSDSWSTSADRSPYSDLRNVGPRRLTLRTEGLSIGPSIGGHWRFRDRWVVGSQFRYANWFLPEKRAQTVFGDSASLAGRVDVFEFGVFLGFRGIL